MKTKAILAGVALPFWLLIVVNTLETASGAVQMLAGLVAGALTVILASIFAHNLKKIIECGTP